MKSCLLFWLILAGLVAVGTAAPLPENSSAVALDAIFDSNQMPTITRKELATRYLQMPVTDKVRLPEVLGFRRIPQPGGRKATLFEVELDGGSFHFRGDAMRHVIIGVLERERGVRMPRAEFEKLFAQCVEGLTLKTGVAPVKEAKPEVPGATVDRIYRWPKTAFTLICSYRMPSVDGRVPFQAEYISLRLQTPGAGE